eukprot:m.780710 g.780710  ORF g.780710 m.780710 type:complete len:64 (-) comp23283_c1_seq3:1713-1904(-)
MDMKCGLLEDADRTISQTIHQAVQNDSTSHRGSQAFNLDGNSKEPASLQPCAWYPSCFVPEHQ